MTHKSIQEALENWDQAAEVFFICFFNFFNSKNVLMAFFVVLYQYFVSTFKKRRILLELHIA